MAIVASNICDAGFIIQQIALQFGKQRALAPQALLGPCDLLFWARVGLYGVAWHSTQAILWCQACSNQHVLHLSLAGPCAKLVLLSR